MAPNPKGPVARWIARRATITITMSTPLFLLMSVYPTQRLQFSSHRRHNMCRLRPYDTSIPALWTSKAATILARKLQLSTAPKMNATRHPITLKMPQVKTTGLCVSIAVSAHVISSTATATTCHGRMLPYAVVQLHRSVLIVRIAISAPLDSVTITTAPNNQHHTAVHLCAPHMPESVSSSTANSDMVGSHPKASPDQTMTNPCTFLPTQKRNSQPHPTPRVARRPVPARATLLTITRILLPPAV